MKRLAVILAALVAACGHEPPPSALVVHASDLPCPERPPIPHGVPRVRTPEQIGRYANDVELAREAERARGDQCEASLNALQEIAISHGWIVVQ